MWFKIGNDIILGGDSAYKLVSPISGLSAPAIRTADGVYAGVDGGYVSSQLYGFRTITLTGFYQGKTCEDTDNLRLGLMNKLHIRQNYPIIITTFSGKNYYTEGFILGKYDVIFSGIPFEGVCTWGGPSGLFRLS